MLFNSYAFILAFLPITLLGYIYLEKRGDHLAKRVWILLASLFFYSVWDPSYFLVLAASVSYNYLIGRAISRDREAGGASVRPLMWLGIAFNIIMIAYFKYSAFIAFEVLSFENDYLDALSVALPLGISFFTFQQIAYLVDTAQGKMKGGSFIDYVLFVSFFPQLIAGPIVHHKEMMPQFALVRTDEERAQHLARGTAFFIMGLFKKVVIADNLAPVANEIFGRAHTADLTAVEAWIGALAYTFQIYFDFSGYSDMAIGLALLFGIALPYNFNSPYKAADIIDFWRRWHMTLSRFLRDYVYIPLGGNRKGMPRRYINLMGTMLLGGLWHGANWTFVVWGGLHGMMLVLNHAYDKFIGLRIERGWAAEAVLKSLVTFLLIVITWVFFRAESVGHALTMLQAMGGANGLGGMNKWLIPLLAIWPIQYLLPNSQEIINQDFSRRTLLPIRWAPNNIWAIVVAGTGLFCMTQLSNVSEFLYFNF